MNTPRKPAAPASRRRGPLPHQWLTGRRHRPALILTAGLLLTWWWTVLGPTTFTLLGFTAAATLGVWLVRRRRALAASIAVAALTALLPGALVIWTVDNAAANAPATAAVLTGYLLAGPVPALLAWTRRFPATHRLADTAVGSVILLVSMIPVAIAGDHGFGTAALAAGLTGAGAWTWLRRRRALRDNLDTHPTHQGWTDLGPRVLPDGHVVDQVLVGHGRALLVTRTRSSPGALRSVVDQAEQLAAALQAPATRLQPVVIDLATDLLTWRAVDTATATATVPVLPPAQLTALTQGLPARTHRAPRVLLQQLACLPAPSLTGAVL